MKTIKPKTKSKKNGGRFTRVKFSNKDNAESVPPDLSQLRKPIDISVSSLLQVTKLLEIGGDEVKTMLAYECDVVYECRICRSLFRSLANFISHKRVYCKEKFNVSLCRKNYDDHIIPEGTFMEDPEANREEDATSKEDDNIRILRSQVVRNAKKDLTSVVDMLQRKRKEDINENLSEGNIGRRKQSSVGRRAKQKAKAQCEKLNPQILLEPIDTSKTAVYQTATEAVSSAVVQATDLMKTQMIELQNMTGRNTAILNADGQSVDSVEQLEKSDSPLQIYGSEEDEDLVNADSNCAKNLVCTVCNAKFATRKTLTYHMKSLHVSYRTCYPCPCCSSTFANTWSVYRHLYKVHRKSNEQVRKLRTQIQEKAFRKETTGAEDIEKENAMMKSSSVEAERETSNNTQEWIEHFELDFELQRCGGCGRRFDRRAALISHSQSCQKRIAACNETMSVNSRGKRSAKVSPPVVVNTTSNEKDPSENEAKDIVVIKVQNSRKGIPEKNIVNNSQENSLDASDIVDTPDIVDDNQIPAIITGNNETSIRVENVSRITNDDWERIDSNGEKSPSCEKPPPIVEISVVREDQTVPAAEESLTKTKPQSDAPEIIFTSMNESRAVAISFGPKKRRVSLINEGKDQSSDLSSAETENPSATTNSVRSEKETSDAEHVAIMENRIATIANLRKLQCLPCRRKFTSMTNLRRHMAIHIGWNRYRCKLCDFKCFVKCDCVAHCNKMHDAKNNRAVIADMVMQIPPDQNALAQEIMMDISNSCETSPEPEVIEVATMSLKIDNDVGAAASDANKAKSSQDKREEMESEITTASKSLENVKSIGREKITKLNEEDGQSTTDEKQLREDECEDSTLQEDQSTRQGTQSKLDNDPDLRKMVMEVIFGTAETEVPNTTSKVNGAKNATTVNENVKTDNSGSSETREIRPQRPTRNRVKPVNEDFIYDLTELLRKESSIHRFVKTTTQKTLRKKQLNQQQSIAGDNECSDASRPDSSITETQKLSSTCKLPALISCKKSETNNYTSKFSLRQAEIKLHPAANGLSSLTNVIGSTNISVTGQK